MWRQRANVAALATALLLAGLAGFAGGAGAQTGTAAQNATVTGVATWANGTPAVDATVKAVGLAGERGNDRTTTFAALTGSGGTYELSVPPGDYTVVALADGASSEPQMVGLEAGERASVDPVLRRSGGPAPDEANVTARVRKTIGDVEAGQTVDLPFSSEEEDAVGVRRLSVTSRVVINETWVEVAAVDGGAVGTPPGRPLRLLYLDVGDPGSLSGMTLLVRVNQSAVGDGSIRVYQRSGGEWRTAEYQRAVASGDSVLLRVDARGPGYVAVVARTTTTTATTWPSTAEPPPPRSLAGSGLRTALGLLALLGAGVLAVRGGRD